jgi:hypothetical protein
MTPNQEAKPTPAFLISFAAGICSLLTAFLATQLASLQIGFFNVSTSLTLAAVAGALTVIGSILMYEQAATRRFGSLLVVGFSIISMNFLGLILGLIGGFLGLSQSSETQA